MLKKSLLLCFCFVSSFLRATPPVDVVYTWVDGADETWLAQKNHYLQLEKPSLLARGSHGSTRFQDRDELRYSLRSIAQFAPWVHHVYIVTAGQRPKWLKDHPFITIVDHKEIFNDTSVLPTFNSQAIEANLHHIPGLSENYIYFNDDVFIGHSAKKSDFFTKSNKAKIFVHGRMAHGKIQKKDGAWVIANKNASSLLSKLFHHKVRFAPAHVMLACKKSAAYAAEKTIPHIFALVSSHRFRSRKDFAMTNGLIPNIAIVKKSAVRSSIVHKCILCGGNPSEDLKALTSLKRKRPLAFCIQDVGANPKSLNALKNFFEKYFPIPAAWEKTD